jgi:hypothetical protein
MTLSPLPDTNPSANLFDDLGMHLEHVEAHKGGRPDRIARACAGTGIFLLMCVPVAMKVSPSVETWVTENLQDFYENTKNILYAPSHVPAQKTVAAATYDMR